MKKITKILLIFLSLTLLFNCSDDNPETTPENQVMRLDSIISTNNNSKILFNYDSNNVHTNTEMKGTNNDDGIEWKYKAFFSYNSNNLINTEIYKEWNDTEYINNMKMENTYNSNLNISEKTTSEWNTTSNNWEITSVDNYIYNSGVLTEIIPDTNFYVNNYYGKSKYIYENNVLKKTEHYRWNEDINDWKNTPWRKNEYSYETNNITDIIEYYDLNSDGVWEQGDLRTEYEYDNTYTINDLILPFDSSNWFIPSNTKHMITKLKDFEATDNDNWSILNDFEYFYTDVAN